MILTLTQRQHEIGEIFSFFFKASKPITWLAGQYINLTMPDIPPVKADRLFTIASAPHEQHLQITTLKGKSAFKQRLFQLDSGDTIEADQVGGDFTWLDDGRQKLFIAGGIGITTFRSIILDRLNHGLPAQAVLLYAGKIERRPFLSQFKRFEAQDSTLNIKHYIDTRLSIPVILKDVPDVKMRTIYLSGSQPFVETLGEGLMREGISRRFIKYDYFDGYETLEY